MAAAVQRAQGGDGVHRMPGLGKALILAALLALAVPCQADEPPEWRFPTVDDTTTLDGQTYSYYYVPHLSELNQLVGYLFRSGLVHKDAPLREATVTRYAAYSCEGTLYVGGGSSQDGAEDVNWGQVTALHAGSSTGPPSLVVERGSPATTAAKPLVLYIPDATIRYRLHQALAVLISECRPRADGSGRGTQGR